MKRINFLFCLLSLSVLLFTSAKCRKDKIPPPVLPAATQEGKNTVGFTIGGEVWVPYAKCKAFSDPCGEISARYGPPSTAIDAIDFQFARIKGNVSSDLTISSATTGTITSTGEKKDSITVSYRAENANGNNGDYFGPRPGSRFFITKINYQNQVISGEFELVLIETNGSGKEITLKDGRFDFTFNACKCSN